MAGAVGKHQQLSVKLQLGHRVTYEVNYNPGLTITISNVKSRHIAKHLLTVLTGNPTMSSAAQVNCRLQLDASLASMTDELNAYFERAQQRGCINSYSFSPQPISTPMMVTMVANYLSTLGTSYCQTAGLSEARQQQLIVNSFKVAELLADSDYQEFLTKKLANCSQMLIKISKQLPALQAEVYSRLACSQLPTNYHRDVEFIRGYFHRNHDTTIHHDNIHYVSGRLCRLHVGITNSHLQQQGQWIQQVQKQLQQSTIELPPQPNHSDLFAVAVAATTTTASSSNGKNQLTDRMKLSIAVAIADSDNILECISDSEAVKSASDQVWITVIENYSFLSKSSNSSKQGGLVGKYIAFYPDSYRVAVEGKYNQAGERLAVWSYYYDCPGSPLACQLRYDPDITRSNGTVKASTISLAVSKTCYALSSVLFDKFTSTICLDITTARQKRNGSYEVYQTRHLEYHSHGSAIGKPYLTANYDSLASITDCNYYSYHDETGELTQQIQLDFKQSSWTIIDHQNRAIKTSRTGSLLSVSDE